MKQWDAFISHASEDKDSFVRELYQTLTNFGLKIWYDEFTLKVGDSLSKSIDSGLLNSDFGVMIISQSFLNKGWPEYEYRSLLSREIGNKPVILPVWYNVTKDQVSQYSLYLADKFAISANDKTINQVALKLLEVLNLNIYKNISRYLYYLQLVKSAKPQKVSHNKLQESDIRHDKLNQSLVNRIEILHELIFNPFLDKVDLDETLDGFKRDLYPHREVEVWEAILAVFLIYSQKKQITDYRTLKDIVTHLTYFSTGDVYDRAYLETEELLELMGMLKNRLTE
jgi:hypothetical protein